MESTAGIVSLFFIAVFIYSFFHSFDLISIILDYTIPENVIRKTRWVLGLMALLSTMVYIVLRLQK